MTLVRFKNRPLPSNTFNNLLSDILPQMPSLYGEFRHGVPVNIKENEKKFSLEFVAPGFNKEDFKIGIENNILTIAVEEKEEFKNENEKILQTEYKFSYFKRSFTVDEGIDGDGINAQYNNGVLIISLPKKEEVKTSTKHISVN